MIRIFLHDLLRGWFFAAVYALASIGLGAWLWGSS